MKYKHEQKYYAKKWVASQSMVSRWMRENYPLDDEAAMCKKLRQKQRMTPARRKALEAIERKLALGKPKKKGALTKSERRTLEDFRDYYMTKLDEATNARVPLPDDVKHWNELLLKTEKCIRESEAHIKKLGIDSGEMLSRGEVERILKAVIYAGNACVRKQIKEVCEVLAACQSANEVYEILPAVVLGGRIFEGVKAVSNSPSEVNLPDWVVKCMIVEGENYFE